MTAGCNERKIVRTPVELRRRREERGGYTMDCTDESRGARDLSNIPATARSRRNAKKTDRRFFFTQTTTTTTSQAPTALARAKPGT